MRGTETGGRQKGVPNKVTAKLREAAQAYTAAALKEHVRLSTHVKREAARVAACRELLDLAHCRSPQAITLAGNVETGAADHYLARQELSILG
jgi:hypothetical protein